MKTRLTIAAALFVAAGSAFAQNTEWVAPEAGFHSDKTVAEVRAELAAQPRDPNRVVLQQYAFPDTIPQEALRAEPAQTEMLKSANAPRMPSDLYYGA